MNPTSEIAPETHRLPVPKTAVYGMFVSLTVHAVLLLGLSLVVFQAPLKQLQMVVDSVFTDERLQEDFTHDVEQSTESAETVNFIAGSQVAGVAAEIISPCLDKAMPGGVDISVVIARNDCDAVRRADALQPFQRRRKLRLQREIDQVAGDRDLIRRLRLDVQHQRIEHVAAMEFPAIARPIEIAERALAGEFAQPQARQRRKMRIGQMGQHEGGHQIDPIGLQKRVSRRRIIS